ncbi:hypothetical protein MATL_G00093170 [Megalops atlanticus]|uniref:non-specific serine/threonine protein kinase n=1 Tax=Megalops atlanticus TaxID=7932 RepID=A0A9D3Q301_MEGAT|nr:hypothetical protein MATL_G00093170 [Megalops atlanticus]
MHRVSVPDIWSLGVILYALVCGRPPFQEGSDSETLTMIMDCRYAVPPHVSADCKERDATPHPAGAELSPEEHELILRTMASGKIAEPAAVKEALEADRYDHITATYYLLGERLRREKQERTQPLPTPSSAPRPDALPDATVSTPRPAGDRALGLRPAPLPETPPARSVRALGRIFEEEEEEEEEEEAGGVGVNSRRVELANQSPEAGQSEPPPEARPKPRNRCVAPGPDGVETRAPAPHGAEPAGRVKTRSLRDRLLRFPLCEKALALNIQPASKDRLLPFGQYNCCRVL